jgi:hypothetical protein
MTAIVTTPAPATARRAGRAGRAGLLAALALAATLALGACADATGPACGRTNPASATGTCATPNLGYYHP